MARKSEKMRKLVDELIAGMRSEILNSPSNRTFIKIMEGAKDEDRLREYYIIMAGVYMNGYLNGIEEIINILIDEDTINLDEAKTLRSKLIQVLQEE